MDATDAKSLKQLAGEIIQEQGFGEAAEQRLTRMILKNGEHIKTAVGLAVRQIMHDAMQLARYRINQQANQQCQTVKTFGADMQERVQKANERYLFLYWPMMSGKLLQDATKEEVLSDSMRYRKNAEGNARNARFMALVGEGLRDGATVGERYTEKQLAKLMQKVRDEIASEE